MSKKSERIQQLTAILKEKNGATVKELAALLNVSEMTIRRDLSILNSNHIVTNVYGAAIYNPINTSSVSDKSYDLSAAKKKFDGAKERIGRFAASMLEENDIIIIDTGSTTEKLAKQIPPDLSLTVLCYNLNILNLLSEKKKIKLILSGGFFHPNTQMFESPEGISLINSLRASKVFISAAGIHEKFGVTCSNTYESPTKNAIMNSAMKRILLADSSKFGEVKSACFGKINEFQMIITDSSLSQGWENYIIRQGIELIMV